MAGTAPVLAVAEKPGVETQEAVAPRSAFLGGIVFIGLLALGFVYDWKKGIFRWR
jgi:NADH:ubiquinone oxidoreductase subunit 3 (subunit A)